LASIVVAVPTGNLSFPVIASLSNFSAAFSAFRSSSVPPVNVVSVGVDGVVPGGVVVGGVVVGGVVVVGAPVVLPPPLPLPLPPPPPPQPLTSSVPTKIPAIRCP
jgi:hypothetical protein